MRCLLLLLLIPFLFCCSSTEKKKAEEKINCENIEGNWEAVVPGHHSDSVSFNLYFEKKYCHFGRVQDNRSKYSLKNDQITIEANGSKYYLRVLECSQDRLKIVPKFNWTDGRTYSKKDTLIFKKIGEVNVQVVRSIHFRSSGCFGSCPSFEMKMTPTDFSYEGISFVDREGVYLGKTSKDFWGQLLVKVHYINFGQFKGKYEAPWTDDETVELTIETDTGTFTCSVYGNYNEPAAIRNLIEYIFSNVGELEMTKFDPENLFKTNNPNAKKVVDLLNKIPC